MLATIPWFACKKLTLSKRNKPTGSLAGMKPSCRAYTPKETLVDNICH
jgi:hypothetical protein